jgi:hypothetical protein
VWKIVYNKFNPKLNELFSFSVLDDSQATLQTTANTSTVAVGILDCCRKLVDRCLCDGRKFASFRLANDILNLMHDIGLSLSLEKSDYANLFKWTQTTFSGEKIEDPVLLKTLINFFIFITWHKNSSVALMKYISHDLTLIYQVSPNQDETCNEQVFNCLARDNISLMMFSVYEELTNIIELCEWFISFKADYSSMCNFYKQFNTLTESIKCLLIIDVETKAPQEAVLRIFTRFYGFMIVFCKSIGSRQISSEEESSFKSLVDLTAENYQKPISQFIKLIQNASSSAIKENGKGKAKEDKSKKFKQEEQSNANKLIKCAKMIPNLVYLIEQYEQQLKVLNKHFNNKIDFTEKFEKDKFRDFQIRISEDRNDDTLASTLNSTNQQTTVNGYQDDDEEDEEMDDE